MQGGMLKFTLAASGTNTLVLPKGATTFMLSSTAYMCNIYAGNNTNSVPFLLMTKGNQPITIENFMGGQYTFEEPTGGATVTVMIWSQGLEESV